MSCELTVLARIIAADGTTVRLALEDEASGYRLLGEIGDPEWDEAQGRVTSPYMNGSAPAGLPTIVDGMLPLAIEVKGATWPQTQARRATLWDAWRAEPAFFLDIEVQGVTTRYRAERSLWRPEPITPEVVARKRQEVALVFRVQPLPTVTYA